MIPLVLLLVGIPLLLGAGTLRAMGIAPRTDRLAWLGWCWVAGNLGTGAVVFAWLLVRPDFEHAWLVQVLLAGAGVALLFLGRRRKVVRDHGGRNDSSPPWERIFFAAVVVFVLLLSTERILVQSLAPLFENDETNFWVLKAKALYLGGGFGPHFRELTRDPAFILNLDYPPLNPILQTWVFAQAGEITHVVNRLPIQLFVPGLVLILAAALRRVARPGLAGLLLLLLSSCAGMRSFTLRAEGDLMVAVGALVVLDTWLRWQGTRDPAWLRLGVLGVTLMVWSKHEGLLLCCAMLGALVVGVWTTTARPRLRLRARRDLLWLLAPLGVLVSIWVLNIVYEAHNNFVDNQVYDRSVQSLVFMKFTEHIGEVMAYFAGRIAFHPPHSNLVFPALFLLAVCFPRRLWRSELRLPMVALFLVMVGYVLVFVGMPVDMTRILGLSAGRVSFHIVPAVILWIAVAGPILHPALGNPRRSRAMAAPTGDARSLGAGPGLDQGQGG